MIKFALVAMETEEGQVFVDPLCEVIRLHGREFDTVRAFEALDSAEVLTASLAVMGSALKCKEPTIICAVAKMISDFVSSNKESSTLTSKLNGNAEAASIADKAAASKAGHSARAVLDDESAAALPIDLTKAPPNQLRYDRNTG